MPKQDTMTWWRKRCVKIAIKIVKIRDNNTCQYCGKKVTGQNCHGSHVVPESRSKKLSCDIQNIKVLCYHCHIYIRHKNPLEMTERFKSTFPDRYEYLMKEVKKVNGTIGKQYFKNMYKELKAEYRKLTETEVQNPEYVESLLAELETT